MINGKCNIRERHMPHSWGGTEGEVHCPGQLFDSAPHPTTRGSVRVLAEDGNPVELTVGSSLLLDDGTLLVKMSQEDFNDWQGTREPLEG